MNEEDTPRRASPADIEELVQLRWEMCVEQGVAAPDEEAPYREAMRRFLEEHIAADECQIWVAEASGQIIANGMLWLFPALPRPGALLERHGHVTNLFTRPAHRRRGVGACLMNALADAARALAAASVTLETTDEAAALYRRLGYAPSGLLVLHLGERG